ncbi:MAG: type I-U CRISPR-associated helicase/endonuclease Cas3 [Pirellulales bacterium]|nr:type I-U CRISPR-associated helicase/endonuclease Cas3 [Pirellulales bacterium]
MDFDRFFQAMTGNRPLSWQRRLFDSVVKDEGRFPSVIDLPTGLGKTMIMAIWLIVRALRPKKAPTRLVYVVDRRTVVDQATDIANAFAFLLAPDGAPEFKAFADQNPELAERKKHYAEALQQLRKQIKLGDNGLAVSTLRGQLADNREWSRDPSRPAIIIGTVDLIGSALLFSGYRSSFKRRPLEAGLLGQDSLLVLDEAHLSQPFEKLLIGEKTNDGSCQKGIEPFQAGQGKPMCVIRMSATSTTDSTTGVFRLEGDFENRTGDFADDTVYDRYKAPKHLRIVRLGEKEKLTDRLYRKAIKLADRLAENKSLRGKRIVVFVRRPDDAKEIAGKIRDHEKPRKSKSNPDPKGPYVDSVEVLTGTMRGLERDELVAKPVLKRFLDGDEEPGENNDPAFLISTSAGEVGFDLNADHLVGDAAPIDSWIQRLGRVNRRGNGDANVILVKEIKPAEKTDFDKACIAMLELLADGMDVSPKALTKWKNTLWQDLSPQRLKLKVLIVDDAGWIEHRKYCAREVIKAASMPEPTNVELTDILLDGWSMTSITERMPGRPPVDPWLRGIAEWEPPQTEIAWRAELDLEGFADLDPDEIEEWFDTHRIRTHETLSVKTSDAATWFKKRWDALSQSHSDAELREFEKRPVIVDRAGLEVIPLGEVVNRLSKAADADAFLRGAEVIVPASFGGIRRGVGLLDLTEPKLDKGDEKKSAEEQKSILKDRQNEIDVADVRCRYREKIEKLEDGEAVVTPLAAGATKPPKYARYALELASDDDKTIRLVSYIPRREKQESGSKQQTLMQHVGAVRNKMDGILSRLSLPKEIESTIKLAAQLAADWHDHGKNREFFQRTVGGTPTKTVEQWQAQTKLEDDGKYPCLGKSGGEDRGKPPRGYRHEFGSLCEFTDAFNAGKLLDDAGKPISQDVFDLAMHLMATHHGRGRPHFPKGGFDPDCESRADDLHSDSIRRFARLQKKYGWWYLAWLENLLRCADALASANEAVTETDEQEGGDE